MLSTEAQLPDHGSVDANDFSLRRFPSNWVLGSTGAERVFARLLWLLVPLQFYVEVHIKGGLSSDDVFPAAMLSLISVAVIFVVSCFAAWVASKVRPAQDNQLATRVRMWVIALMVGTAGSYMLLALSFAAAQVAIARGHEIYGDLVTHVMITLLRYGGADPGWVSAAMPKLQIVPNFIYASATLVLVAAAYRFFPGRLGGVASREQPGTISVGLVVALIVTAANLVATVS